ncbi:MAG TPA: hypothetical protein VEN78_17580 [Bradyrhizobium sp.]|nr:hypothetical protein [Bradyrhizobium sp.]
MDDVGVGHSGLSQMEALGANTIKIAKFFVDTITQESSVVGFADENPCCGQEVPDGSPRLPCYASFG